MQLFVTGNISSVSKLAMLTLAASIAVSLLKLSKDNEN